MRKVPQLLSFSLDGGGGLHHGKRRDGKDSERVREREKKRAQCATSFGSARVTSGSSLRWLVTMEGSPPMEKWYPMVHGCFFSHLSRFQEMACATYDHTGVYVRFE